MLTGPRNKREGVKSLAAAILKALESFAQDDAAARQTLSQLAVSHPADFFAAGIAVLAAARPSDGSRYLVLSLAKAKRLSMLLLEPRGCGLEEALAVTRAAAEAGAHLQATFEMALDKALQGQATVHKTERILRILDLMAVGGGGSCWNAFQVELMAYPDKIVRSKAAFLIGKSTGNMAWIARRLLDRDPRVQASAVEALWSLEAEEAKPHFLSALKSSNCRVAANAALGLYLTGDVTAMRCLLDMLEHDDPSFRLSALWAIGETQDERFLPILAEHYKVAEGRPRLAMVKAMSRIRQREKTVRDTRVLEVHLSQAAAENDGLRRLAFALSCHPARDLSGIKPNEFAVWENGVPIEDYQVRLATPPAVLLAGFVVPWSASADQAYEKSLREGLTQCLAMKRADDLWRIDRYSVEMNPPTEGKSSRESIAPYDDSLLTPEIKAARGCISDSNLLRKIIPPRAPPERAAADPVTAFERQCDAFSKRGGKRHVFLFLHDMSGFDLKQEAAVARLRTMAQESSVVLHGVGPDVAGEWPLIREL